MLPVNKLPPIIDATTRITTPGDLPKELIKGLLYKRSKLLLGGGSKSYKTWTMISMAIAVACGTRWLSRFETTRAKVLYINLELQSEFINRRIIEIADSMHAKLEPGWLDVWDLRGYVRGYEQFIPQLQEHIEHSKYELTFIDPVYKILGNADENKATDVTAMMNKLEELCGTTNTALAISGHFSKGDQSGKNHMDRISGSGAFARDADSIITFTRHQENGCYTVDGTLRNHPPFEPFVVEWHHPLMEHETGLNPKDLQSPGRKPRFSEEDLLGFLDGTPLESGKWFEEVNKKTRMSESTFHNKRRNLQKQGKIDGTNGLWQKSARVQ